MTRKSTTLGFIVLPLAAWLFAGCDDTVAPLPSDEWTVMAYIKSDVRLRDALKQNIAEMEAAATDPRVNVIVQADFPSENTFRRVISGETSVEDLEELDMANPATLREFVQFATQRFPAQRFSLTARKRLSVNEADIRARASESSERSEPAAHDRTS
ncbi:MAG: hypothetical protein ACREM1_13175 [Longimicrobiales bacterium]